MAWERPYRAPAPMVARKTLQSGQLWLTKRMADRAPKKPVIAPTERSISAQTMTKTMPIARMEVQDICRKSRERFLGVPNVPPGRGREDDPDDE